MLKFQTKDRLGRQVRFGLNVVGIEKDRHIIVARQLDNYTGPSITNAAEEVWLALEAFTAPGARCIEYYPETGSMEEVLLQRGELREITDITWVPVPDADRTAIISLINADDQEHDKQ